MTRSLVPMAVLCVLGLQAAAPTPRPPSPGLQAVAATETARMRGDYGRLPLVFEANEGQTDSTVRFLARGRGYSVFLAPDEAVVSFITPRLDPRQRGGRPPARSISACARSM